jgi:hypothetical protein
VRLSQIKVQLLIAFRNLLVHRDWMRSIGSR